MEKHPSQPVQPTEPQVPSTVQQQPVQAHPVYMLPPKDKTAAVLLAVFLGLWTWLYTYRKDAWKFWLNLGVVGGLVVLILPTFFLSLLILPFAAFGSWLWAVIDAANKPDEYYLNFYR